METRPWSRRPAEGRGGEGRGPPGAPCPAHAPPTRKPGRAFLSKPRLLIEIKTYKVTEDIDPTRRGEGKLGGVIP